MVFKPGESGNPGGKQPHKTKQIQTILLPHVQDAVNALLKGMRSDNPVPAAKEVLDRVFGKSKESLELSGQIESIIVNINRKTPSE